MHCDDAIDDEAAHPALRTYLAWARQPAIDKDWNAQPKLFATRGGKRCRVVMASRFGDVGIRFDDFDRDSGYSLRCDVADLTDFSTTP